VSARDDALLGALADRVAHDDRTAHLDLDLAVRGGVAHVRGRVASRAERGVVRRVVRSVAGIHAAWDLVEVAGEGPPRVVDVGCGGVKQVPEAVGVDRVALPGVDVVADLEQALPLETASFDHAFAVHVLEHVSDLVGLMGELHRVLAAGGVLHVLCPRWTHPNAWRDPTHVRGIDAGLFRWFAEDRPGVAPWRPLAVSSDDATVHVDLERADAPVEAIETARWFDR
jgi:SAM-dependent methyltransferase